MRLPSSVQGMIFAPVLVCLFFILKAFCPESAGDSCFADQFAVPIFLPLVAIYKIFGNSSVIGGQEFLLILAYWAFVGFLVGLLVELFFSHRKSQPAPQPIEQYAAPTVAPVIVPPKETVAPSSRPVIKIQTPVQAPIVPPPAARPVESIPVIKAPPAPPANLPGAQPVKPPINLLDRAEFK